MGLVRSKDPDRVICIELSDVDGGDFFLMAWRNLGGLVQDDFESGSALT